MKKRGSFHQKKGSQKGSQLGKGNPKLTQAESDVLCYLTDDFLPIKKVALKRRTSIRAVQKIVKRLKDKGVLQGDSFKGFAKIGCAPIKQRPSDDKQRTSSNKIRLHGQEWNIKILEISRLYENLKKKSNFTNIDGNTIRLFKESIEIYSSEDLSFTGNDPHEATSKSLKYWNNFFRKIENRYNLTLIKAGYHNIKLVKQHYAEINNELAKDCNEKKVKVNIFAPEDGKLWFTIDDSWNLNEAETLHPETAQEDMHKVKRVFDDIRVHPDSFLPSKSTELIAKVIQAQEMMTGNQQVFDKNMKSHLEVLNKLGTAVDKLGKAYGRTNKILSKLAQTRLTQWK